MSFSILTWGGGTDCFQWSIPPHHAGCPSLSAVSFLIKWAATPFHAPPLAHCSGHLYSHSRQKSLAHNCHASPSSTWSFQAENLAALMAGIPGKGGPEHKSLSLITYRLLPVRWKASFLETYRPGSELHITTYLYGRTSNKWLEPLIFTYKMDLKWYWPLTLHCHWCSWHSVW